MNNLVLIKIRSSVSQTLLLRCTNCELRGKLFLLKHYSGNEKQSLIVKLHNLAKLILMFRTPGQNSASPIPKKSQVNFKTTKRSTYLTT